MAFRIKGIINFIKAVFEKWIDDKAPKLGASLAFYTIFSLSPLFVIVVAIAGLFFGPEAAQGELAAQIEGLVGKQGAEVIQTALKSSSDPTTGLISLAISLFTLILGSTAVFIELQDSLDMIWKVKPRPGGSLVKGLIKDRLKSFAMVISIGFLLLVSLAISAAVSALSTYMQDKINLPFDFLQVVDVVLSLLIMFLLFGVIFKVLPDVHLRWRDVWVGSLTTAFLFSIGKKLIGMYLGTNSLVSTYGAAGSLVLLLLWVYYSAQILFLGAEFTQVYANKYGSGIIPRSKFMKYDDENAVSEKQKVKG